MDRIRLSGSGPSGGAACFSCTPSGCPVLDCVLGGGWAEGRIANIIGDKSTGKTLLAIEAAANFAAKYKKGSIWYNEVEAGFDRGYAETLGLPRGRVQFTENCLTVEDMFDHLERAIKEVGSHPGLYIIDSLDALSDESELKRGMDEGTYGVEKAKKMSQLFRRLVQRMSKVNLTVIIISQIRDKIGVTFGKRTTRSGGRALDFYASQVISLAHVGAMTRTRRGLKRTVGIKVKARCDKNKVSLPFRECEFPILFGYGVDDLTSSQGFLESCGAGGRLSKESLVAVKRFSKGMRVEPVSFRKAKEEVRAVIPVVWDEIESEFKPKAVKY